MLPMEKPLRELAEEVTSESYNYNYPNSPSTLFLFILAQFGGIEDDVDVLGSTEFGKDPILDWREWKLLIHWLNKADKITRDDRDMQFLYDLIVAGDDADSLNSALERYRD